LNRWTIREPRPTKVEDEDENECEPRLPASVDARRSPIQFAPRAK
jgi:hypothetical protein